MTVIFIGVFNNSNAVASFELGSDRAICRLYHLKNNQTVLMRCGQSDTGRITRTPVVRVTSACSEQVINLFIELFSYYRLRANMEIPAHHSGRMACVGNFTHKQNYLYFVTIRAPDIVGSCD